MADEIFSLSRSHSFWNLLELAKPMVKELFFKGELLANRPMVAIVGTRRASPYGLRAAASLASQLAERGVVVVSGLARGVDAAAHRGALAKKGFTFGVLAHGLDRIYPPEHQELAQEILLNQGALISEHALGVPPLPFHFPGRNRIIAALSEAVIVVEAAQKSGALITAEFAMEMGKEVFVVPGPFDKESFRGSHDLINDGARLLSSLDEVLGEVQPAVARPGVDLESDPLAPLANLLSLLGGEASLQEIFEKSSLTLPDLMEKLEEGTRRGLILQTGMQHYCWLGKTA